MNPNDTQNTQLAPVQETEKEVNLFPILRSILLIVAVIFSIGIILYLLYLNGKSVYENGV
jgi:hypothetical protein